MIRTPCAATTMKAKGTTAIMAVEAAITRRFTYCTLD